MQCSEVKSSEKTNSARTVLLLIVLLLVRVHPPKSQALTPAGTAFGSGQTFSVTQAGQFGYRQTRPFKPPGRVLFVRADGGRGIFEKESKKLSRV